jgi:hypothetical protein
VPGRRPCPAQAEKLVAWAAAWPERTWAVEGARGLGGLLAQQLVAAGERVLDVQPKLAARVRLLQTGNTGKSGPNDALSVAVAALRSTTRREVIADDHACVLKVRAKRHCDLSRARNQAACRLHALLYELIPGGVPDEITAGRAAGSSARSGQRVRSPRRAASSRTSRIAFALVLASYLLGIVPSSFPQKEVRTKPGSVHGDAARPAVIGAVLRRGVLLAGLCLDGLVPRLG